MEWYLLFGHLVGEYLLQNRWMTYHKKAFNLPCLAHCTVYTMSVSLFLTACPEIGTIPVLMVLFIFISHWIISRYELLDWWFNVLDINSWNSIDAGIEDNATIHHSISISLGTVKYMIANDTLQLLLLWIVLIYFF